MAQVPTGTKFFAVSTFGPSKNVTVATNAAECVMTSTTHGYSNGDILEITSNWGRLNQRYVRIKSVATDTFTLEGIDTTNTSFFPPGSGTGSVRKVTGWQQISQVLAISASGGDPKNVEYQYLDNDVSYSVNDGFAATTVNLELDADSISTAGYLLLRTLTAVQTLNCLRIDQRNGATSYQPGTVALNETVQMQSGQINRVRCQFSGIGLPARYSA